MSWNITIYIGVGMIAVGSIFAAQEHFWIRKAEIVPGTVIAMIRSRGSKGGSTYKPRVRFTAKDGSKHEFERGYSSNPPDFSVGDKVMVAYESQTYSGRILTFGQRFGFASILIVIGLSLTLLGGVFLGGRTLVPKIYLPPSGELWE